MFAGASAGEEAGWRSRSYVQRKSFFFNNPRTLEIGESEHSAGCDDDKDDECVLRMSALVSRAV